MAETEAAGVTMPLGDEETASAHEKEQVDQHHEESAAEEAGPQQKQPHQPAEPAAAASEPTPAAADIRSSASDVSPAATEATPEPAVAATEQQDAVQEPAEHAEAPVAEEAVAEAEVEQQAAGAEEAAEHHQQQGQQEQREEGAQELQQHATRAQAPAAAAAAPLSTTGMSTRAANGRALTFSGPPYVPVAKPYKRADYSHSAVQLMKIAHDNQLLVSHLTTISKAVPSWKEDASAPPAPGNTASSAVNRRKAATVIAQANHALYQRLVAIRPSEDISRDTLEAKHRQDEVYRNNCAQFKTTAASSTRKAAAAQ